MIKKVVSSKVHFQNNALKGKQINKSIRFIKDLDGIFQSVDAFNKMNKKQKVYEVDCYFPIDEGKDGGLFFGVTRIFPGKVGSEYFMTKGHFHKKIDRGEFYWCIDGVGYLLFMNLKREYRIEKMTQGSLHYVPGYTAHRVINIGDKELSFGACSPSDAGHDYKSILENGFSVRIIEKNGNPSLINE
jgi:glucose-6-phosphate isomerase